jgi:ABC-2 type transport system ATP-binding protein
MGAGGANGADEADGSDRSDAAGSADAAVVVRGLVKRYGDRAVVDGLDLTVRRGQVVALLGPNGAGKTTTVEVLEGYRRRDSGDVRVLGLDPSRDATTLRAHIGLMLQSGGIYQYGRPRELLHLFASFYHDPMDADALLERVGLGGVASKPYRVLSGGERQRLSLALALVGRPELAILDEPTAGMDPAVRAETRTLIAGLRQSGVTVLLTTHDLGDVEALADRVAIVSRGRLLAEGTPQSLAASDAAADVVVRASRPLTADEADGAVRDLPGARAGSSPTDIVLGAGGATGIPAATAWFASHDLRVVEVRTAGASLEERYLALVGPDAADAA